MASSSQLAPARGGSTDLGVQGLRTVAIVLLVAGHTIGAPDTGLRLPEDSGWRVANMWLELVRMPLFAALSGFVYALRPPVALTGLPRMTRGKARRLLVPLVVVGTLFYAVQTLVPGTNNAGEMPLWRIYLFPYAHFWFLLSLFVIFLVVGLLDAYGLLRDVRRAGTAVLVATVLSLAIDVPGAWDVLSIDGALTLLPFFLLGLLLCRYGQPLTRRPGPVAAVGSVAAVLLVLDTTLRLVVPDAPVVAMEVLQWVIGILAITALVSGRAVFGRWRLLVAVGPFVFGIYLFHSFATAGTRIVMQRIGLGDELALIFAASLLAGLVFPVLLRVTVGRHKALSWALFGERPYARRGAPASQPPSRAGSVSEEPRTSLSTGLASAAASDEVEPWNPREPERVVDRT